MFSAMEKDVISSFSHHFSCCWKQENIAFPTPMPSGGLLKRFKIWIERTLFYFIQEKLLPQRMSPSIKRVLETKWEHVFLSPSGLCSVFRPRQHIVPFTESSQFMLNGRYFVNSATILPQQINKDLFWFQLESGFTHRISSKNLQLWFSWFQKLGHHMKEALHKRLYALRMASH